MNTKRIERVIPMAAMVFSAIAMFWLTNKYAVNILYWDEWDFYSPLFVHHNWWTLFSWQHGPHRQGISFVLLEQFNKLTAGDSRAESFYIAGILSVACAVAFGIKKSLFDEKMGIDLLIPLVFLTLTQMETIVGTPNPSHSAFPLLMLMVYVYLSIQPAHWFRVAALALLQPCLLFTGFGLTFMPAALIVLLADLKRNKKSSVFLLSTMALSCLLFLKGYGTYDYLNDYKILSGGAAWSISHCFQFIFNLHAIFFGLDGTPQSTMFGAISFFSLAGLFIFHLNRFVISRDKTSLAFILLAGTSLTFSMLSSYGRAVVSPRYMTLLIPGFFAFCLHLSTLPPLHRNMTAAIFALFVLNGSVSLIGTLKQETLENLAHEKTQWKDCYLKTENIDACNEQTKFQIYPNAAATHLKEKLDFLKTNHLNLFNEVRP